MDKQMLDAAKHIEIMDFLEDLVTQHNGDITYMAVKHAIIGKFGAGCFESCKSDIQSYLGRHAVVAPGTPVVMPQTPNLLNAGGTPLRTKVKVVYRGTKRIVRVPNDWPSFVADVRQKCKIPDRYKSFRIVELSDPDAELDTVEDLDSGDVLLVRVPREQLKPFVVYCFLNDGKLLHPKRIELDKAWSWTECLEELCLSLGAAEELGSLEIMKVYTRDGFELNTFQELVDSERIIFSLNGEAFREPQRFSPALESEESTTSEADAMPAKRVQLSSDSLPDSSADYVRSRLAARKDESRSLQDIVWSSPAEKPSRPPAPSPTAPAAAQNRNKNSLDITSAPEWLQLNFIVVGESSTGKTCLVSQFAQNIFPDESEVTIGVDINSTFVRVKGRLVKIVVWDTMGLERYRSLSRSYYRKVAAAILVFDVTSRNSFRCLESWRQEIVERCSNSHITLCLCGNKVDLVSERRDSSCVTTREAEDYAREHGMLFAETSAKEDINVSMMFSQSALQVVDKIEAGIIQPNSSNGVKMEYWQQRSREPNDTIVQSVKPKKKQCACVVM